MKLINIYLNEKLTINKNTKVISNPKTFDDLLDFIDFYLEEVFSIPENDREFHISQSKEYQDIDIYLNKKYGNDSLYDNFAKLEEIIKKTPFGSKNIEEAWCDHKGIRLHYSFKK